MTNESNIEVAYRFISAHSEPVSFSEIWEEVLRVQGFSEAEAAEQNKGQDADRGCAGLLDLRSGAGCEDRQASALQQLVALHGRRPQAHDVDRA